MTLEDEGCHLEELASHHLSGFHAIWADRVLARVSGRQASRTKRTSNQALLNLLKNPSSSSHWIYRRAVVGDWSDDGEPLVVGIIYTGKPTRNGLTLHFEMRRELCGPSLARIILDECLDDYWSLVRVGARKDIWAGPASVTTSLDPGTAVQVSQLVIPDTHKDPWLEDTLRSSQSHHYVVGRISVDRCYVFPRDPVTQIGHPGAFIFRPWPSDGRVVTVHSARGADGGSELPRTDDPGMSFEQYCRLYSQAQRESQQESRHGGR